MLFSLVVKLMAGSVGMWGWGVMDRVYRRASVSVLQCKWHEDHRNRKWFGRVVWKGFVENVEFEVNLDQFSFRLVKGTGFTSLPKMTRKSDKVMKQQF